MNAPTPEFLRSTQIFNDYMTPDAIALVERAKAMAPRLAERAFEAENADVVVMRDAATGQYRMRTGNGAWVAYVP